MDGHRQGQGCRPRLLTILRRRIRGLAAAGTLALTVAGCTPWKEYVHNGFKVGPNYKRPPAPVAPKWIDTGNTAVSPKSDELRAWWTVFNDPILNDLVCCAVNQNLNVRQAGFRVLQYRALLGYAVGRLFPQTQTFDTAYQHQAVSLKVANRVATPQRYFSTWAGGFNLAWEADFWGKYRRFIEEFSDRYDASIENYDAVMVTLLGDVATSYVQLRTLQAQLGYTLTNIKLQEAILDIATTRFKNGFGQNGELDVDQATTTLERTRALVPQLEIQIRETTNRLSVLMGMPPEDLAKKLPPALIPSAPPQVCAGIPAELLTRRPDIRQAEREAAAECARIGIEVAELYPAISVSGTIGRASEYLPSLFTAQAWRGTITPTLDWKLLYYGRISNLIAARKAAFQEAVVGYQQKVLTAAQEVENGIVTFLKAKQRVEHLEKAVEAAEKAVNIAKAQYGAGTVDFNRVAVLMQNLVDQQNLLAQAQGEVAQGLVMVYRALGGGWQVRLDGCPPNPPPASPVTAGNPGQESKETPPGENKQENGERPAQLPMPGSGS